MHRPWLRRQQQQRGVKRSLGTGGRAESSLGSPHIHTGVGAGAALTPVWVFAIPVAQAAKTRFTGRPARFTAEVGVCLTLQSVV